MWKACLCSNYRSNEWHIVIFIYIIVPWGYFLVNRSWISNSFKANPQNDPIYKRPWVTLTRHVKRAVRNPSCVAAERQAAVVKHESATRGSHSRFCSLSPFFRVTVKHPSPHWLPVPGHLVCKRYEIPPTPPTAATTTTTAALWATRNDARKTGKETGLRPRSRDKKQSCKCHVQTQTPVSQCYFHPPLSSNQ